MNDDEPPAGLSCNPTMQQLYDYLGGDLSDPVMSEFRSHLQLCPGCDDVFHFHQGLLHMVGSSCREEIPAELRRKLRESITRLFP
ncbi:MAG: zf-HC2 domain-containing protein [Acidimicrobiia bacterium]|nr:zf-HC2 domain-containing protein [Acidimicrobiia bacterium]